MLSQEMKVEEIDLFEDKKAVWFDQKFKEELIDSKYWYLKIAFNLEFIKKSETDKMK